MAEREKLLLSLEDTSALTGIPFYSIERLIDAGALKTRYIPQVRGRFIARVDLDEWILSLPVREPFVPPTTTP